VNCLGSFYLKKAARVKSGKEFHLIGSDNVRVSLSNQVRLFFEKLSTVRERTVYKHNIFQACWCSHQGQDSRRPWYQRDSSGDIQVMSWRCCVVSSRKRQQTLVSGPRS